jgi:type VI secretion system secreted protein VgrG
MHATTMTITLDIQGLDAALRVRRLDGSERMNGLYAFDLLVSSPSAALDYDGSVGRPAVITFEHGAQRRSVHGIVGAFEQAATEERETLYAITLAPHVWILSQNAGSRILQGLSTAKIIEKVLGEAGLPKGSYRLSLQAGGRTRELCVQYQESDWAFLSRLMEEEGIFYFFEHGEEGSSLVIADHTSAYDHVGADPDLPFAPPTGGLVAGECVETFRSGSRIRPGKVTLREVPFDAPAKSSDDAASYARDANVERYAYPSGPHAKARLEALQVSRNTARGTSRSVRLYPGAKFRLSGHPRPSFDAGYVVTQADYTAADVGDAEASFECTFACVPQGIACRPEPTTPKPYLAGPQTARVVGPSGTEIHVDDKGRVLVKLEWDRSDAADLANACWVPISQGASGAGFGSVTVPRVGSYVLVEHLCGDPDRPIITGRVFNSLSPYPYTLPADKTKSTMKSRSTPGGGGFNELRFEDKHGSEQVYLRAQRDLDVEALHDRATTIGRNDTATVGGDRKATISGNEQRQVNQSDKLAVGGSQTILVEGDRSLAVAGDAQDSVKGDHTQVVEGDHQEEVIGSWGRVVGKDSKEEIQGSHTAQVGGDVTRLVDGDELCEVGGNQNVAVTGNLQQIVDGQVFASHGALSAAVTGKTSVKGTDEVKIESDTTLKMGAPKVYMSGDSTIHIRAYEKIILEVASGNESDDDDDGRAKIEITADGIYLTHGSVRKNLSGDKIRLNC